MQEAIVVLQSLFYSNMFAQSYLQTASQIIKEYKGGEPFASFLKKFFSAHKKYGSRDRKQIAHLSYCYFRLGGSFMHLGVEERILAGLYLCNQTAHPVLALAKPQWNDTVTDHKEAKIKVLQQELDFHTMEIFPYSDHLSTEIDPVTFAASFLYQPDTYLRIRPGKEEPVRKKLDKAAVSFMEISDNCIAVPPTTKMEAYLQINDEVVVQDASSQNVLLPLIEFLKSPAQKLDAWDCCAASGGKSILLKDHFPNSQLTVSDIRDSILANLRKRFQEADITKYKWFVADISSPQFRHNKQYDLIICDAPCSGSGTWARTPEQLNFFTEDKIQYYSLLQQRIAYNASRYLKNKGMFLYITCSVFTEENERVVDYIQKECSLQLYAKHYISGYQKRADTLFTALFIKGDGGR